MSNENLNKCIRDLADFSNKLNTLPDTDKTKKTVKAKHESQIDDISNIFKQNCECDENCDCKVSSISNDSKLISASYKYAKEAMIKTASAARKKALREKTLNELEKKIAEVNELIIKEELDKNTKVEILQKRKAESEKETKLTIPNIDDLIKIINDITEKKLRRLQLRKEYYELIKNGEDEETSLIIPVSLQESKGLKQQIIALEESLEEVIRLIEEIELERNIKFAELEEIKNPLDTRKSNKTIHVIKQNISYIKSIINNITDKKIKIEIYKKKIIKNEIKKQIIMDLSKEIIKHYDEKKAGEELLRTNLQILNENDLHLQKLKETAAAAKALKEAEAAASEAAAAASEAAAAAKALKEAEAAAVAEAEAAAAAESAAAESAAASAAAAEAIVANREARRLKKLAAAEAVAAIQAQISIHTQNILEAKDKAIAANESVVIEKAKAIQAHKSLNPAISNDHNRVKTEVEQIQKIAKEMQAVVHIEANKIHLEIQEIEKINTEHKEIATAVLEKVKVDEREVEEAGKLADKEVAEIDKLLEVIKKQKLTPQTIFNETVFKVGDTVECNFAPPAIAGKTFKIYKITKNSGTGMFTKKLGDQLWADDKYYNYAAKCKIIPSEPVEATAVASSESGIPLGESAFYQKYLKYKQKYLALQRQNILG
jgi:hypothetical protein